MSSISKRNGISGDIVMTTLQHKKELVMNWYKEALEALEALGMIGNRQPIRNKLNKVYSHAEDEKLRGLVEEVIYQFDQTSTNTSHTSLLNIKSVKINSLNIYCKQKAFLEG
jgi:hypothetical protein